MTLKETVEKWIQSGADHDAGLDIYVKQVVSGHPTINILRKKTPANHQLLIKSLCYRAGIKISTAVGIAARPTTDNPPPAKASKLRDDYAFLSEAGTPNEMKVLVSNKITAYHAYKAAHAKLFENLPADQEFANVRNLVENYIENHAIHRELSHYQKTRTILGKHQIFEEMKRLRTLRNTSIVELVKKKRRAEHNIWRLEKLIAEKKKPHLDFDRRRKIQAYQQELLEIKKVVGE